MDSCINTAREVSRSGGGKWLLASLLCLLFPISAWAAKSDAVAIFYPDVRQPYLEVFQDIVTGFSNKSEYEVLPRVLSKDIDLTELRKWVVNRDIKMIIALGRNGVDIAQQVAGKVPIIASAFVMTPDENDLNISGISLVADPELLFENLKSLSPNTKRINVVYDPTKNSWLISLAKSAAKHQGLELIAYKANDLRQAAAFYKDIIEKSQPNEDAIWLPLDSTTVNSRAILPLILKEAWNRSLTVFSSNPSHAINGALFSLFPNNVALGKRLATMAKRHIEQGKPEKLEILPLEDLQLAVNIRTADHLGLEYQSMISKFDLIFPAPTER